MKDHDCFQGFSSAMLFNTCTLLESTWILFQVIQYTRYSISDTVKCDLLVFTLNPNSFRTSEHFVKY
jgi:hypothetical protein